MNKMRECLGWENEWIIVIRECGEWENESMSIISESVGWGNRWVNKNEELMNLMKDISVR